MKYSEGTIRKKALNAGYKVEKGFQHYHYNGAIHKNMNGERFTGYNVLDLSTNTYVLDCYDNNFDHLWSLEDVEEFISSVYKESGLEY